jgi:UDP-glucose 4-epimerase
VDVVVTGSAGFVGRAVVRELVEHGHRVTAWTRRTADLGEAAAVRARLRDLPAVDAVVHLAGASTVRESWQDPARYYATNVGGTANLLQALPDGPVRVVFASTCAVYGSGRGGALREDDPTLPGTPYAASKAAAEELLGYQARTGRIGVTTLRLFNVAGALPGIADPNTTRVIASCLRAAAGGTAELRINGDGSARREFTHVAAVAVAFRLALETTEAGVARTLNVGTGVGVSVTEVIAAVRQVTGGSFDVRHNPPADEPQVLIADVTRARVELGWSPARSTLPEIIADAWRYGGWHPAAGGAGT